MKIKKQPDEIRQEYDSGRQYKESIGLFETYEQNEAFYVGDQWRGVDAEDMDKPVLNILRRVVSMEIAKVVSEDWGINFEFFDANDKNDVIAQMLIDQVSHVIERTGLKALARRAHRNECVDGDAAVYFSFDADADSGMNVPGMIRAELLENTDVYFGNKYDRDVQRQPYILVHQKLFIEDVKDEARENGVKEEDVNSITAGGDEFMHAGSDRTNDQVSVITKFWKENGTVHAIKTVGNIVLRKEWDTGGKLYPISWSSWEIVKRSYHGRAMITGLIPNQIALNKAWAGIIWQILRTGFSIPVVDANRIKDWDGSPGSIVKTSGGVGSVRDAVMYLEPAQIPMSVINAMDALISNTRDCMGASDATMGNVNPDNASAIIALQQADEQPLELRKEAFHDFVEDMIRNILDIMRANYGKRKVLMQQPSKQPGTMTETKMQEFDFQSLADLQMSLDVDIGASSLYSEQLQVQTISNLLTSGILKDPAQLAIFLEAMPRKLIPKRQKLMNYCKSMLQSMLAQQADQATVTTDSTPLPDMDQNRFRPRVENTTDAQP